ncbi:MAG TPA: helix-turn-helix domain-containing protein [Thermoanaerobaculia bacterium]
MAPMKTKEELVEQFRVDTIQEAALRVIARKGLSAASMQEIAEEAGIAKGTLYLYFENQQDLLRKTIEQAFSKLADELNAALEGPGDHLERLERQFRAKAQFLEANVALLRLYAAAVSPEGGPRHARCGREESPHFQRYMERLELFLAEAMEAGEIRRMRPERLALFVEEGFTAILLKRLTETDSPPIEEDIEWVITMFREGLTAQRSRA